MTAREEAAAAAREQSRMVASYEVVDRPLERNGRTLKPGARVRLSQADGDALGGRVRRAGGKTSKPAAE